VVSIILVLTGLAISACKQSEPSFRGTVTAEDIPQPEFTLTDQHGQTFTLSDQRGKVVLLFFGFTYCPDVCPLTLSTWKHVEEMLKDDASNVRFVYITVDPERDTPEKLREHLAIFSPNFIGLTGTLEALQQAYSAFGIYREKVKISESAAGYIINHTSRMYLIDRGGRWQVSFSHDAAVEDIAHDLRELLKQPQTTPLIRVENVWSWPAKAYDENGKKTGTGAVYLTLVNDSDSPDRLLRVHSEVAEVVEMHETKMVGDRMEMQPVTAGLEIPAHGQFEFKPRGSHLMLIGLNRSLEPGQRFAVVLEFEKSGAKTVYSEVRQP
jgi:protein SCO1/2